MKMTKTLNKAEMTTLKAGMEKAGTGKALYGDTSDLSSSSSLSGGCPLTINRRMIITPEYMPTVNRRMIITPEYMPQQ